MTQLGNEEYVRILLDAQERVFGLMGHFHHQMHLLGAIYTQFYGSFMQAFQVSNGVTRVNKGPVKSGFQCQEQFAIKLYHACNQFMLRMYCKSLDVGALIQMMFVNNVDRLQWILSEYQAHHTSWEVPITSHCG
jgi:hypothetical protein